MFDKILIANRGEIAVRIIRACREMGIKTVAVYSEADRDSLHTLLADEAICIGPAPSNQSYLNMERILAATVAMKAEAIHPGFGFLSENARFAELCQKCSIAFIGPSAEIINKMGNKSAARKTMVEAGVPVVPGSKEPVYTVEEALKMAKEIGFPVMIKASSGGGGKGMRVSWSEEDFEANFQNAQMESVKGFSDDTMYLERFVENPRHIEFQIMADKYGNVVHLGERDCSIQRRHQKVLEEAPAPGMTPALRAKMGEAAVAAAKAVGYVSTLFGRRRALPELASSNFNVRSSGERMARNTPIQGTAADVIKLAMVRVWKRLRNEKMESRLILTVHDELIVEAPQAEAEKAAQILREEMEGCVQYAVPLSTDVHAGKNWLEAH